MTAYAPHDLAAENEAAEAAAVGIDGGFGRLAVAAIAARPVGPARAVDAAAWVQRAIDRGLEQIATIFPAGGMTDDELDATTELHCAIARMAA